MTVKNVLQNFQTKKRKNAPHVLVHRYGELSCDEGTLMANPQVTFRQYPRHTRRVSNKQQTEDYLNLMEDASQMLVNEQHNANFSHVMFLDDDVELCPGFGSIIEKALTTFPSFGMGHLGRGGSGIIISAENIAKLRGSIMSDSSSKNVDKSMLEWALRRMRVCTLRPVEIQMRHVGLISTFDRAGWEDTDKCRAPANNVAWQGLSESASADFFGEYCLNPPWCSPHSSVDGCINCTKGFSGEDCGIPSDDDDDIMTSTHRENVAPIVALLSGDSEEAVVADSKKHNLINLYVIGNKIKTSWLTPNVYTTTREASVSFKEDLKDWARWGTKALPADGTIFVHKLLSPQELWTMKYYLSD
jgi:hypothetical protein